MMITQMRPWLALAGALAVLAFVLPTTQQDEIDPVGEPTAAITKVVSRQRAQRLDQSTAQEAAAGAGAQSARRALPPALERDSESTPALEPIDESSDESLVAGTDGDDVVIEELLADRIEARKAQIEREQVAKRRFEEGLSASKLTARDVDASVRTLFRRMELELALDEDGMMLGLEITSLDPESPLAALDFRAGDRIFALDGTRLRDPADLPALLAGVSRSVNVCVERDGASLCSQVHLE